LEGLSTWGPGYIGLLALLVKEGEEKTHNEMTKLIEEDQAKKADAEKAIQKAKSIRDYEAVIL